MKRLIIFIVVGILIFTIITTKNEFFASSSPIIELTSAELTNIKKSIDGIANTYFTEAKNKLGETNIKILVESFIKTTKSLEENKKELFEKDVFVQNILNDEKIALTENIKQSLYLELFEAYVLDRNLNIIPIRLIAVEKIINDENIKKIKENLFPNLKNISKTFISYMLKYYDNTVLEDNLKFDTNIVSLEQINQLIKKNPKLLT
jgi:hypothetical protein